MNKIGTHNSVTGEKSYGVLSKIVAIFSICQFKTIQEQLEAGCTYFDIRVCKTRRGWICAHGLWESKRSADSILQELNDSGKEVYVRLTLEKGDGDIEQFVGKYPNIKFTELRIKNPFTILKVINQVNCEECYAPIYKGHKELFFPVPLAWKKKVEFNNNVYKLVDFL